MGPVFEAVEIDLSNVSIESKLWEYDVSPCTGLPYADLPQAIHQSQYAICSSSLYDVSVLSLAGLGLVSPARLG